MIPRTLEPEVMDTEQEAVDYDSMDHAEVNRRFVAEFLEFAKHHPNPSVPRILDVGTGTAQIPIELCRQHSSCHIVAIDLSREMLKLGEKNIETAGLTERIRLEFIDAKALPYDDHQFDAVISNSIIHHIPEPSPVLGEMKRVLRPGGVLFVRDLLRPEEEPTLEQLVQTYAGDENAHQQKMFRESLHAALTIEEMQAMLQAHQLPPEWVQTTSDRHWTIAGCLSV
ncbi:MAG: class I SAM-dependent methyltransferase [Planctomycetaceae bacterium]|nr:class I SAM-dependent methyltransferase [Planctomycetaceae bacterium]